MPIVIVCVSVFRVSGNSDIRSTTSNANCSPRWIVYPDTTSDGAQSYSATQQRCLEDCVDDSSCVIAEWINSNRSCRIHNHNRTRLHHPGITQFEIVRRCDTTSGTPYITSSCVVLHITQCLKKRPTFTTCYNFYIHSSIATIFGTSVAQKVENQNVLYFPTSPN